MAITLHASGAETASSNTATFDTLVYLGAPAANRGGVIPGLITQLDVTAASGTNETLDVLIQESMDDSTWYTLETYTQATGVTNAIKKTTVDVMRYIRAKWTIGGTDTPTFTFSVILDYRL